MVVNSIYLSKSNGAIKLKPRSVETWIRSRAG